MTKPITINKLRKLSNKIDVNPNMIAYINKKLLQNSSTDPIKAEVFISNYYDEKLTEKQLQLIKSKLEKLYKGFYIELEDTKAILTENKEYKTEFVISSVIKVARTPFYFLVVALLILFLRNCDNEPLKLVVTISSFPILFLLSIWLFPIQKQK